MLVRILAIVVGGAVAALPAAAFADRRAELQAKGEQLAKDGRFVDAIESFKAADRIEHRAIHACLIALAYTRRELWPQAELWLATCNDRAHTTDPLPDWVPLAEQQLRERLTTANVVEVAIEIKPTGVPTQITVSSFAPDEMFAPRTIHLPVGTHVVFARADGYRDAQQVVEIKDKTPKRVVIELTRSTGDRGQPAASGSAQHSRPGTTLLIAGGAALVFGGASHVWMAYERDELVAAGSADDRTRYDTHETRFDVARIATIGFYAAGAALIVTGLVKRTRSRAETTTISALPLDGGAFVTLGWQR